MANPAPPENFLGQRRAAHLPPAVGGWRAPAGPRGQGGASAPGLPEGWARRPVGGGGGPPGEETAAGCRRQEARGGRAGWMARRAPAPREALNLPVHEAGPTRADPGPPRGSRTSHLSRRAEPWEGYIPTPTPSSTCGLGSRTGVRGSNARGVYSGDRSFSYVSTVPCAGAGVRNALASAGGTACIAIRPS